MPGGYTVKLTLCENHEGLALIETEFTLNKSWKTDENFDE